MNTSVFISMFINVLTAKRKEAVWVCVVCAKQKEDRSLSESVCSSVRETGAILTFWKKRQSSYRHDLKMCYNLTGRKVL